MHACTLFIEALINTKEIPGCKKIYTIPKTNLNIGTLNYWSYFHFIQFLADCSRQNNMPLSSYSTETPRHDQHMWQSSTAGGGRYFPNISFKGATCSILSYLDSIRISTYYRSPILTLPVTDNLYLNFWLKKNNCSVTSAQQILPDE